MKETQHAQKLMLRTKTEMAVNCFEKYLLQTEQDNENWTFFSFLSLRVGRVNALFPKQVFWSQMFQPLVLCISNKTTLHLPVFVSELHLLCRCHGYFSSCCFLLIKCGFVLTVVSSKKNATGSFVGHQILWVISEFISNAPYLPTVANLSYLIIHKPALRLFHS